MQSKPQGPSRRHHYIPEFYLKRWANADGRLTVFTRHPRAGVTAHERTPGGTGWELDLYSMRGAPEGISIEDTFFRPVDDYASITLDLMEKHGSRYDYTMRHRRAWATFVVSLLTRCPEDIATLRRDWRDVVLTKFPLDEVEYARLRDGTDPVTLDEYIERFPDAALEKSMFRALTSIISSEPIGQDLSRLDWTILTSPPGSRELLTSDRPISWSTDFGGLGGHMIMPIGPRKLLIAARDPEFAVRLRDSVSVDMLIRLTNIDVVEGAAKFVFASNRYQHRFISNRLGISPVVRHLDRAIAARRAREEEEASG